MVERGGYTLFQGRGWKAVTLSMEDRERLQALHERCSDYSLMMTGKSPGRNAAKETLTTYPPGHSEETKIVLGIENQAGELIGVLDLVRNYPESGTWWMGLLLIDPEARGGGLGGSILREFETWVLEQGAEKLGMGIAEQNESALRFWRRNGYSATGRDKTIAVGRQRSRVLLFEKQLA